MSAPGLLLVNLGSPDSTDVADVRRYLNQFLMDPYVVDMPWPLRRLLVTLILRKRPAASAHAYASIWTKEGSPLIATSVQLQQQLQSLWPGPVELAMRYGQPDISSALARLQALGCSDILVAPLYPQFAASTTTTVQEAAHKAARQLKLEARLHVLPPFYAQPAYLDALAETARPWLEQPFDHLLFSYHGLPERHVCKADPSGRHCLQQADCCRNPPQQVQQHCYRAQCYRTSEGLVARLGLQPDQWSVAFQSRLGRAKWIEPYTDARLDELAASGIRRLLVICPAFVADCLETLEEIGIRAREQFQAAGGESLTLIPCLNAHPAWVAALNSLCRESLPHPSPAPDNLPS